MLRIFAEALDRLRVRLNIYHVVVRRRSCSLVFTNKQTMGFLLGCSCDPPNLVKIWRQNFEKLGKSRTFVFFQISSRKAEFDASHRSHLLNYMDHFTQITSTAYSKATVKISSPQRLPKWRGGMSNITSRDTFVVAGLFIFGRILAFNMSTLTW